MKAVRFVLALVVAVAIAALSFVSGLAGNFIMREIAHRANDEVLLHGVSENVEKLLQIEIQRGTLTVQQSELEEQESP
jgi:hypothetical protein